MSRICVVTGFVPLKTRHVNTDKYHDMAATMIEAASAGGASAYVGGGGLEDMWLLRNRSGAAAFPPAHPRAADRYETDADFVASNIVQHNRTTWAVEAADADQDAEILVWIDYGILKQGDFTGRRVHPQHIAEFIARLAETEIHDIPFPGMWPKDYLPPSDDMIPWRFAGSVHIWPRQYLREINQVYKDELRRFVDRTHTVPLDLPIWAITEQRTPWLPWRQYIANHDSTQFTNYYPIEPVTELCALAEYYGSDKGGRHLKAGETCHEYTVAYHQLFAEKRLAVRRVLEVGVNYGCSLRMWADYFPNAEIVGLDNAPRTMFEEGRIRTLVADQSSAVSLYRAMAQFGNQKFDVVIDDGSHEPEHQALTANVLLPFLEKDGHYIIEDIHLDSQPWEHVKALPAGYRYRTFICPNGIGKAHDPNDHGPEQLIVITHE